MTDCQGDSACEVPMELYEILNLQGDKIRALKAEKAAKVSSVITVLLIQLKKAIHLYGNFLNLPVLSEIFIILVINDIIS